MLLQSCMPRTTGVAAWRDVPTDRRKRSLNKEVAHG